MRVAARVLLAILAALPCAAFGAWIGFAGLEYHAHDMVGPLIFGLVGAVVGFNAGLLLALGVAFVAFPLGRADAGSGLAPR